MLCCNYPPSAYATSSLCTPVRSDLRMRPIALCLLLAGILLITACSERAVEAPQPSAAPMTPASTTLEKAQALDALSVQQGMEQQRAIANATQ